MIFCEICGRSISTSTCRRCGRKICAREKHEKWIQKHRQESQNYLGEILPREQ